MCQGAPRIPWGCRVAFQAGQALVSLGPMLPIHLLPLATLTPVVPVPVRSVRPPRLMPAYRLAEPPLRQALRAIWARRHSPMPLRRAHPVELGLLRGFANEIYGSLL